MASKRYSIVDKSVCVACGACENICPLGAIKVHKGCFAKVAQDKCVGCAFCPMGTMTQAICKLRNRKRGK